MVFQAAQTNEFRGKSRHRVQTFIPGNQYVCFLFCSRLRVTWAAAWPTGDFSRRQDNFRMRSIANLSWKFHFQPIHHYQPYFVAIFPASFDRRYPAICRDRVRRETPFAEPFPIRWAETRDSEYKGCSSSLKSSDFSYVIFPVFSDFDWRAII